MKAFFYRQFLNLSKVFSPEIRLNLGLRLITEYLKDHSSVKGYEVRRRILDRFLKSYPVLYSHEAARVYGFFELLKGLKQVPGDLVECGVGRGRFLTIFAFANDFFELDKTVYGFDSFSGFPIASEEDFGTRVKHKEKISGWDDVEMEMIHHVLNHDVDAEGSKSLTQGNSDSVKLIKGYFCDTLGDNLPAKIAFLHLDADLYQSTVDVLNACIPKMASGSVIVFDELHETEKWPGVHKAVEELCKPQGHFPVWDPALQRYKILF